MAGMTIVERSLSAAADKGRSSRVVWKFGDNINTDLMLPGELLFAPAEDQMKAVFAANRPGWVNHMQPGDIIVGGLNDGTGRADQRLAHCAIWGSPR